jgi:hypothetical protein
MPRLINVLQGNALLLVSLMVASAGASAGEDEGRALRCVEDSLGVMQHTPAETGCMHVGLALSLLYKAWAELHL